MKKELFKILSASLVVTMLALTGFASIEPALAQAATANDTVIVTLNVDTGISITSPADTTMSTSLGVSTNSAIATTTWNVKTNSTGGYILAVKASSSPAMRLNSDVTKNIANFTEAVAGTPEDWGTIGASTAEFGYSAFGTDVVAAFDASGVVTCGATSTPHATLNYVALSTSDKTISSRTSTTTQSGVNSTVCYAVAQGSDFYVGGGTYSAWVTATATTQ